MNKKILAVTIASIFLLSACVGLAQVKQAKAVTYYKIQIRVTQMKLYNDGDGQINGIDRGELYMIDPQNSWPSSQSSKYKGGYVNIAYPYLYIYQELWYNIEGEGCGWSTTSTSTTHQISFTLMDKDWGADDQLWSGKINVNGVTNDWVSGWSGADNDVVSLGSGVTITTWNTLEGTHHFYSSLPGTPFDWYQTFMNSLHFEVRVVPMNII